MKKIEGLGNFEEKYLMLYRNEEFSLFGRPQMLKVQFNCINTKDVTEFQKNSYMYLKQNLGFLNNIIAEKLKKYSASFGCNDTSCCNFTAVQFNDSESFFLVDVPWDEEQGIAVLFDIDGNISIQEQDSVL